MDWDGDWPTKDPKKLNQDCGLCKKSWSQRQIKYIPQRFKKYTFTALLDFLIKSFIQTQSIESVDCWAFPLLFTNWVKQISKNFMKFIHDSVNSKEKLIINRDSSSCNNPLRNFEMRNNLSFENRSGSVIKLNVSQN